MDYHLAVLALQIHRQAALIAVEGGEKTCPKAAETAGMVALRRRLDLDDIGAELGKHQPGGRSHHRMAELPHSYAIKRCRNIKPRPGGGMRRDCRRGPVRS